MKILKIIKKFFETKKIIDKYCLFNKKLFKEKYSSNKNSEILIEFNGFQVNHTGLAAMSNVLAKKFDAKIVKIKIPLTIFKLIGYLSFYRFPAKEQLMILEHPQKLDLTSSKNLGWQPLKNINDIIEDTF